MSVIVVGVDDSDGAKAALRFALEEAKLRQVTLRVVHAWRFSGRVGEPAIEGSEAGFRRELDESRRAAEAALDVTVQDLAAAADGVEIERRVVEGAPATVLVEESRSAQLLVVGARGLGGFTGLLLGSVSQQCAHHAACPVMIVRAETGAH